MPPAARMPSAPSGGVGMPAATCARPQAAKTRAVVPTAARDVAASSCGARSIRTPKRSRTIGTAYPIRPTVPATTAWTTVPTDPGMPHHSRAATTTARARSSRPMPSRRCSGSRSRPVSPTLRATAPVAWARPIHVLWTARRGSGRPPLRAPARPLARAGRGPPGRGPGRRWSGRATRRTYESPWPQATGESHQTHPSHAGGGRISCSGLDDHRDDHRPPADLATDPAADRAADDLLQLVGCR